MTLLKSATTVDSHQLPIAWDSGHAQRIREQAELAAIASGFTNPERAGELAVRRALHLAQVQR